MAYIGNSPGVASQRIVTTFTATASQTTFTPSSGYTVGYLDVYHNGVKLINGDDYTASNGTTFVLASGAASGDVIEAVAYLPRGLSDGYTKAEADTRYVNASGDTMTGALAVPAGSTVGGTPDFTNYSLEVNAVGAASQLILHRQGATAVGSGTNLAMQLTQTNGQSARLAEISADFISNWGGKLNFGVKPANSSPNNSTNICMSIDSSGRVTMPYQLYGWFRSVDNSTQTTGQVTPIYTTAVTVRGASAYNTSNGNFTAPVSGVYHFNWVYLYQNLDSAAYIDDFYKINGVGSQYIATRWLAANFKMSGDYVAVGGEATVYLNQNDIFTPSSNIANDTSWNFHQADQWGHFQYYLVG
jgi:hypothetical protein